MEIAFVAILAVTIVTFDIFATRAIVLDGFSSRGQKVVQLALTWVVPLIGAIIVLAVHRKEESPSGKYYTPADPGDDFAASGHSVNRLFNADPPTPD